MCAAGIVSWYSDRLKGTRIKGVHATCQSRLDKMKGAERCCMVLVSLLPSACPGMFSSALDPAYYEVKPLHTES